jgi:hypothetical protein
MRTNHAVNTGAQDSMGRVLADAVYETVGQAVYDAVYGPLSWAVYDAVYDAVYRAVDWTVWRAVRHDPTHPALRTFLADTGEEAP